MTWYVLRSLEQLYRGGSIRRKQSFVEDPEVANMIHSLNIIQDWSREIRANSGFDTFYEGCYKHQYEVCKSFLDARNLNKPQTRLEVRDVEKLIELEEKVNRGDLDSLRQQILAYRTSLREVSHMFFRNEKYLEGKDTLIRALKSVLKVDAFSNERDQQYIYKLECYEPQQIVLCENLNFLTKPELVRKHHIELWYAGGKNVDKLRYTDRRGLPIYYSADWDKDGLEIFLLVKEIIPSIVLLTPTGEPVSITKTEHRSLWQDAHVPSRLSGLSRMHFSPYQVKLIEVLISNNQWIVEESNDLVKMLSLSS